MSSKLDFDKLFLVSFLVKLFSHFFWTKIFVENARIIKLPKKTKRQLKGIIWNFGVYFWWRVRLVQMPLLLAFAKDLA